MDSRDQLLLNHAPQVYILIHSDLTLTCFDFELKFHVVRLLFNITIYYLIPWHFRVALLPKKSLPTTWLTRYSGKQVLGAPLVIALATSTTVYSRVILLDCEQLLVYYHYLSATWSTAGSYILMWALGNYLMQLWSPLQVAAPLSQVPNPQWRWLCQAWPCHLSGSGHPPQLGSKQTLQKTVTWHWCVVQNSGNQHSIGCQIPVTSHKWQPLEGSHDRQLAHHVEKLLKRFYFSLLWVSKGYCWQGLKKGNPTIMYSLFCSQEQEIYVSNLVPLWSSYVR